MNILDKIVIDKRKEIQLRKSIVPISQLEQYKLFGRNPFPLAKNLKQSASGIIAEHKRRSPSKQIINYNLNVHDVALGYKNAGVCGMSVLTDGKYFGGALDDLILARASCNLPLLRKEFIIEEYQIIEAKAFGADVVLLIAAILTKNQIKQFLECAKQLGMEVLLEIHNRDELQKSISPDIDMIGVNNRNLKTFEVSIDNSKKLSTYIPDEFVKVSESGISTIDAIKELRPYGYQGFLIGENFMKTDNPGASATKFIKELES